MKLSNMKDRYQEKMVLVLGGGPSLKSDCEILFSAPHKNQRDLWQDDMVVLGTNHHALVVGMQPDYQFNGQHSRLVPD
jgi:hypothetical protein